jgi:hypothetical protein
MPSLMAAFGMAFAVVLIEADSACAGEVKR